MEVVYGDGVERQAPVFSDGRGKRRHETIEAGHRVKLVEAIKKAKEKFGLSHDAKVVSCYEAGRDGFWLHRYLVSLGIENQVVDSSSIDETNRRKRRAKTDRIDGVKLLTMLMRYWGGERGLWSVVRVPSVEDEEARRLHRELGSLQKERTRHIAIGSEVCWLHRACVWSLIAIFLSVWRR